MNQNFRNLIRQFREIISNYCTNRVELKLLLLLFMLKFKLVIEENFASQSQILFGDLQHELSLNIYFTNN